VATPAAVEAATKKTKTKKKKKQQQKRSQAIPAALLAALVPACEAPRQKAKSRKKAGQQQQQQQQQHGARAARADGGGGSCSAGGGDDARGWTVRKPFWIDASVHIRPVRDAIARVEAARSDPSAFDQRDRQPSFAGLNVHNFGQNGGPQPTAQDGVCQIVFHVNAHWRLVVLLSRAEQQYMVHSAFQSKHETTAHGQRGYKASGVPKAWANSCAVLPLF
jgi:hypothetical protein